MRASSSQQQETASWERWAAEGAAIGAADGAEARAAAEAAAGGAEARAARWRAKEAAAGGGGGGASGEGDGDAAVPAAIAGTLWKRASKVHVAAAEGGPQSREWVSRHFRLLPSEGAVVYLQQAAEPLREARGIIPLCSYARVEEAHAPGPSLHAFQLAARSGAQDSAFVLAASSAEEKEAWMARLAEALQAASAEAPPGVAPSAQGQDEALLLSDLVQQDLAISPPPGGPRAAEAGHAEARGPGDEGGPGAGS